MRPLRIRLSITFLILAIYPSMAQPCCNDREFKYPLKSVAIFCQTNLDLPFMVMALTYGERNKLAQVTTLANGRETGWVKYYYNDNGSLYKKQFQYRDDAEQRDRTMIFHYNGNHLAYEGFDDERGNNTKYTHGYSKNGLLASSNGECNGNRWTYSYEYDTERRLAKKYKDNTLEVTYEYFGNLVILETHYRNNNVDKEIVYEYDTWGQLLLKKENGEIIEKNTYDGEKLVERWLYYFGIDPCYYPCCNQYVLKYDYY